MDAIRSKTFGRIPEVAESFPQLIEMLLNYEYLGLTMWRGHADIDWRLDSSAIRYLKDYQGIDPQSNKLEEYLTKYEKSILNQTRTAGHGYYEGRELSDLELLSVIQHHGGATRLVDFTYNVFTALWFACRAHQCKYGLLMGACEIHSEFKTLSFEEGQKTIYDDILVPSKAQYPPVYVWQPLYLFERMRVQQSCFLFSRAIPTLVGSLAVIKPISTHYKSEGKLRTIMPQDLINIAIAPSLKKEMNKLWKYLFGYDSAILFPDIAGISEFHSWDLNLDF